MAALIRCGLRKGRFFGQYFYSNVLRQEVRQVQKTLPFIQNLRCLSALPDEKKRLLVDIHSKIDRNNGISTELFNSLQSTLEKHGSMQEQDIALLLHICSFGPFDSSSQDRLCFAESIWSKIIEMDIQPTSKLYNMKLKAYCANGKNFVPLEELAAMKSLGINPDKITYGLLIEAFCQKGDIAGASTVLEAMDDAGFFIGISVFNSFVTGHLTAGSPEEAENVLETMRSRGLSPDGDTYYRFIQHYANVGDADSVLKYIKETDSQGISLDQSSLIKIYRCMLLNGHQNAAKEIIPVLIERDVFRNSSMQLLCQLAAEGFHNEALNLYLSIPKLMPDNIPVTAGSFLLKSMVANNMSATEMIDLADKLLESKPKTTPHRSVLGYSYWTHKYELAMQLLEALISQKHEVRIPQILPALCNYRNSGNIEGVYKTTDMILNAKPCEELFDTLKRFCYPALTELGQSDEDIVKNMQEHESKWNAFFMISEFQKDGFDAALQSAKGKPLDNHLVSWIDDNRNSLIKYIPEQKESCMKLLTMLMRKNNLTRFVFLSVILNRLSEKDLDTANYILDYLKTERFRLPYRFLELERVTQAPQEIQEKLRGLSETKASFQGQYTGGLQMRELKEMTKEELEAYVKDKPNHNIARIALLNKALIERDLAEIQRRLREIQALKFNFPKFQLLDIIITLAQLGDLEMAREYFNDLRKRFGNRFIDTLPLTLAVKYVEVGNFQEALDMINAARESEMKKLPGREYIRRSKVTAIIGQAKTMDEAEAYLEALLRDEYLKGEDAKLIHHQFMKKSLDSDDDDKTVVARLIKLREKYWVFPCMDMVICRFIKKQDVESLKEVMNLGTSVVGSNFFHHKLACNFIVCGMPSKAASVFQKLNDINSRVLETTCKYWIKEKKVEQVKSLVDMLQTLPVSRAVMLKQLIDAYVTVDAMDKAIDVLHTYDNEFLIPHKTSLNILAAECKKRNMEQPEILKTFLSKQANVDQTKANETDDESSSSSSSSDSDSDTDKEDIQGNRNSEHLQNKEGLEGTTTSDTKAPIV